MKVALAHSRYRHPGGEERHVDLLAGALVDAGHCVTRIEPAIGSDSATRRLALGTTIAYRPSARRFVARRLQVEPAAIVHFHNIMPLLTPSALRAAKASGARVVMTLHNYRFACPSGTLLRHGRRHEDCLDGSSLLCGLRGARTPWVESVAYGAAIELQRRLKLLTRWVDAFVVPAAHLRDVFVRAGGPEDRTHVIANGVPLTSVNETPGAYAFFAGRLSAEKGFATLLRAAELLPEMPFVVAGDGPLAPLLRTAPANVEWVGPVTPHRASELRRGSAFVLVPSEWAEILPYAAIEALSEARPLVASRSGGLCEIVTDGVDGLLVPEGDAVALAAACSRLWGDSGARLRMGVAARATAEERFDLGKQTSHLIDLYESLVDAA